MHGSFRKYCKLSVIDGPRDIPKRLPIIMVSAATMGTGVEHCTRWSWLIFRSCFVTHPRVVHTWDLESRARTLVILAIEHGETKHCIWYNTQHAPSSYTTLFEDTAAIHADREGGEAYKACSKGSGSRFEECCSKEGQQG